MSTANKWTKSAISNTKFMMDMKYDSYTFKSFANDLQKARISSAKYQYVCCLPGCKQKALKHSHIIPQCVLKKYVCNSKHKLLQNVIDEIHPMSVRDTGELPLDKFQTLGDRTSNVDAYFL